MIWQSRSNRPGKKCPRVPVWVRGGGGAKAKRAMPKCPGHEFEWGFPNCNNWGNKLRQIIGVNISLLYYSNTTIIELWAALQKYYVEPFAFCHNPLWASFTFIILFNPRFCLRLCSSDNFIQILHFFLIVRRNFQKGGCDACSSHLSRGCKDCIFGVCIFSEVFPAWVHPSFTSALWLQF